MLTHETHEIFQHFEGVCHFPRRQRLSIGTSGYRVLDFEGNPMSSDDEHGRQYEKILMAPLMKQDRERVFTEDLLVDLSGLADPNRPVLSRVSSPVEIFPGAVLS